MYIQLLLSIIVQNSWKSHSCLQIFQIGFSFMNDLTKRHIFNHNHEFYVFICSLVFLIKYLQQNSLVHFLYKLYYLFDKLTQISVQNEHTLLKVWSNASLISLASYGIKWSDRPAGQTWACCLRFARVILHDFWVLSLTFAATRSCRSVIFFFSFASAEFFKTI